MCDQAHWEARYVEGDLPWDTGRPDRNLIEAIAAHNVSPCRALEIGCGSGTNSLWMADAGFDVTAFDISSVAIEHGREKAAAVERSVTFLVGDALTADIDGAAYDFAFDRGCFHSIESDKARRRFAERVAAHLSPHGLWLSLIGSRDGAPRESGPPRMSALEIAQAIEPCFEIVELTATHLDSNSEPAPEAWRCLMRKRRDW